MSGWVAGAIVVGAVITSESAKSSSKRAARSQQTELQFEQERYDDWQEIYGPLQENLSEYYSNLSPDQYEVTGLQAIEEEKARSLTMLNERLAQRGISDSGLAAASEIGIEMQTAADRASVRQAAPGMVAQQQLSFLQVGLGQDPSQSMSDTLSRQANQRRQDAARDAAASAEATSSAITAVGSALGDYYGGGGKK